MARIFSSTNRCGAAARRARPFGLEGKNRPLEFRLLHVVQFADNGDIQRENVWIDFAAILQQLPQD